MFSKYDFRNCITKGADDTTLTKACILESWPELIRLWITVRKPDRLLKVFQDAIRYNVASQRYNPLLLINIDSYPEFQEAVLKGLLEAWVANPVRLEDDRLTVGQLPGNIQLPPENQLHLLEHIRSNGRIRIQMGGGQEKEVGIWMTRTVQEAYSLINRLSRDRKNE
jgi:hypothetical protein